MSRGELYPIVTGTLSQAQFSPRWPWGFTQGVPYKGAASALAKPLYGASGVIGFLYLGENEGSHKVSMMSSISIDDYVAVHNALNEMSHVLLDWHLFCHDVAPTASGHLLRAASHVYDAAEALSLVAVAILPVVVDEGKDQ